MKGYLLSVICVTFICTLVGAIGGDGPGKELRRMLTGCALAITILAPVVKLDFPEFRTDSLLRDASVAVREGEEQAVSAKLQRIRSAVEAYILTKAESMGLSLTVQVALDDTGLPRSVNLHIPMEMKIVAAACILDCGKAARLILLDLVLSFFVF